MVVDEVYCCLCFGWVVYVGEVYVIFVVCYCYWNV